MADAASKVDLNNFGFLDHAQFVSPMPLKSSINSNIEGKLMTISSMSCITIKVKQM